MGLSYSTIVIPGEPDEAATRGPISQSVTAYADRSRLALLGSGDDSCERYLIACGLIGLPVPPVMISGGPQKKNS